MTFLGLETRNDLPKVSYMTALDYFVTLNFAFIFATIVQFAIVHYFTKIGSGEYYIPPPEILKKIQVARREGTMGVKQQEDVEGGEEDKVSNDEEDDDVPHETVRRRKRGSDTKRVSMTGKDHHHHDNTVREETIPFQLNSVSQIDKFCRVFFPVTFIVVNYFYWNNYLNDDDEDL